jgi:hypothetical protein
MNYTELVAEIQSYTENVFSTADVNTFITQTEQRVYNTVQPPAARNAANLLISVNNPVVTIPSDYLFTYSVAITPPTGGTEYLLNKDANFLREAFPAGVNGKPAVYALSGPYEITVAPNPDSNYPMTFVYFRYPPSITVAGTSWLGDNFSPVLLYGSLVEAYTFMKGDNDLLQLYNTKFNEAIGMLKQLTDAKNRQDSYRDGQVRYPVK